MIKNTKIARKSLDGRFQKMRPTISNFARPPHGWIRSIRDSLGMTAKQLAKRIGVSHVRVVALEKGEVKNSLTLDSLEGAARALGCTLVYALVPNQPLEEMVQQQASKIAKERLQIIEHTMRLENQGTPEDKIDEYYKELTASILQNEIRYIWDKS